ncbi:MAG: pyrroline-5-carboxylate reductase [Paraglaciecola psychrophila]
MPNPTITFIGAGNMASSIIGGLIAKGFSPQSITASDPFEPSRQQLHQTTGVSVSDDNLSAIEGADILVLAVKPQMMKKVLEDLAPAIQTLKPLIISIAAGIEIASMNTWLGGGQAIVRCMPNTPALVQAGATALYANSTVNTAQRAQADTILSAVGSALWVDSEAQLDAVTAVSGSGPAYFFLFMESMQAAAKELGLSDEAARELTLQTALGAAKMAIDSDVDTAELRRRVSSPGGTTVEAIAVFQQRGLTAIVHEAMTACRDRSAQLARELDAG